MHTQLYQYIILCVLFGVYKLYMCKYTYEDRVEPMASAASISINIQSVLKPWLKIVYSD